MAWMAGIGIGLQALSAFGQMGAAGDAKRASRQNAQLERMETAEQARRLRLEQREREGMGRVAATAGGTTGEGSQESVLERMRAEHRRELTWLQDTGRQRERVAVMGGNLAARQARAGALGTLAGAATNAYAAFGPKG